MKKLSLILVVLIFCCSSAFSQPCLPEGITFTTQSQIDSFQIIYPNCTEIEGYLVINGSDISNLNGLNELTSIGGDLNISYNQLLTTLSGLDGLTSIGGELSLMRNYSLTSLLGLDNVTSIEGNIIIFQNNLLTNLTGMEGLTNIEGELFISGHSNLLNLSGLDNLSSLGGHLRIGGQPYTNNSLTSLTGLEDLTTIGGDLKIENNNALTSLEGLDNVTSIMGRLWIDGNDALTSLEGLDNVTFIGENITIGDNNTLTSLSGLDNIDANSITDLTISWNNNLSTCEVQSVCDYLISPTGSIEIHDNATGCNSQQEVEDACDTLSIGELYFNDFLTVSPNPFTTSTTLSYTLEKPENVQCAIYNVQSQIVYRMEEKQDKGEQQIQWNAEGLPAGMYYFRIQAGKMIGGGKMVKME